MRPPAPTQPEKPKVTVGIPTYNRSAFLRQSIESALAQSYPDFRLVITDNASTDDTAEVVASYDDPRIVYTRSEENVGMTANFNRVLELTDTEFVTLLYDDDLFYPDYLKHTVEALEHHPDVGAVHTGFDVIGGDGNVLERAVTLMDTSAGVAVEPGKSFIERSMNQDWMICSPSALFRTEAIGAVGGFPVEAEPLADVLMFRRIALEWNIASLSMPLVGFRVHGDTASANLGSFTGLGYEADDSYAQTSFRLRTGFLDEAGLPAQLEKRYRSIAEASLRRDTIRLLANRARSGGHWRSTNTELARLVRAEPRTLRLSITWRLMATQVGARRARDFLRKLTRRDAGSDPWLGQPESRSSSS